MLNQTFHQKRISNGYIARRPLKVISELRKNKFLKSLKRGKNELVQYRADFDQLQVQAIVVPVAKEEQVTLLSEVPWIKEIARDSEYIVFSTHST